VDLGEGKELWLDDWYFCGLEKVVRVLWRLGGSISTIMIC
jgi:hypothetical protein